MIITNPEEILVEPRTFIAVCGLPNSGKTTFCERHFFHQNIVSTDSNLENIAGNLLSSFEEYFGPIPTTKDSNGSDIRMHMQKIAMLKNEDISRESIIQKSKTLNYVVLDSLRFESHLQFPTLELAHKYFEHNFVIYLNIPEEILLRRPKKELSPQMKSLGFSNDFLIENLSIDFWYEISHRLKNNSFETVYLLTTEEATNVKIRMVK